MLPPNAKLTLVTPPATEPLSLDDAKNYLRVEIAADDALIGDLIAAARLECEHGTGRSFLTTGWRLTLDYLPFGGGSASPLGFAAGGAFATNSLSGPWGGAPSLQLPRPPLIGLTGIAYVDQGGRRATLDPDDVVVSPGTPGRIAPTYGGLWPFSLPQIASVAIDYTAGYGDEPAAVPRNLIQAMRILTAFYYEGRSSDAPTPSVVESLCRQSWWPSYG